METRKCPACGKELIADAKFCTKCGRRIAPIVEERLIDNGQEEPDVCDGVYNKRYNYAEESDGRRPFLLIVLAAIWGFVCDLWDAFGETVISVAVLAVIAHFTMPSDEKMIAKAEKEMMEFASDNMKKIGNKLLSGAGDVLSLAMLSDDTYNTVKKRILGDNRIVVKDH